MLNAKQVKKILNDKEIFRQEHERKLRQIKNELIHGNQIDIAESKKMEEWSRISIDLRRIDKDPIDYCFGCGDDVDRSIVTMILKAGNFYNQVINQLTSKKGFFGEMRKGFLRSQEYLIFWPVGV